MATQRASVESSGQESLRGIAVLLYPVRNLLQSGVVVNLNKLGRLTTHPPTGDVA